ncbi:MAG TPA: N-acetylmuramoyl-L-alanine amidase [Blastocatellia bacterium]|nr:N-acetylmuramoyl-L-alanine amidase [Blastocatellia bacterium]
MKRVVVTAGHGGSDPGAISPDRRYREADLALRLRNLIADKLRTQAVIVLTDGKRPAENAPLVDAIALVRANSGPAVEIHFNAGPPAATGVEVLSRPEHKCLAQQIAQAIAGHTGSPIRGESGWKNQSAGQHHRLGFCEAGGLVVEVEFITNLSALNKYLSVENEIAAAIAEVLAAAAGRSMDALKGENL